MTYAMDQWSIINALHCHLPHIAVLLITHLFIEKCDNSSGWVLLWHFQWKSELLTRPGCMEDCSAMHLYWTNGPLLHRQENCMQKLGVLDSKLNPVLRCTLNAYTKECVHHKTPEMHICIRRTQSKWRTYCGQEIPKTGVRPFLV